MNFDFTITGELSSTEPDRPGEAPTLLSSATKSRRSVQDPSLRPRPSTLPGASWLLASSIFTLTPTSHSSALVCGDCSVLELFCYEAELVKEFGGFALEVDRTT